VPAITHCFIIASKRERAVPSITTAHLYSIYIGRPQFGQPSALGSKPGASAELRRLREEAQQMLNAVCRMLDKPESTSLSVQHSAFNLVSV
jgi:hypothetical protein